VDGFQAGGIREVEEGLVISLVAATFGEALYDGDETGVQAEKDCGERGAGFCFLGVRRV